MTARSTLVATCSAPSSPTCVSEQHLDHAHVDAVLQQVRGKRVPQGVRRHPGAQARRLRRHVADAVELPAVIGSSGSRLGNSQPCERHCSHHARSSSSSCGESIACRSFLPLPCSTRISMRLVDIADTQHHDLAGSELRHRRCSGRLVLQARAGRASRRRPTSSGDSTRGSFRGSARGPDGGRARHGPA